MRYFVTGATGFVGGRVTQHLMKAGHEVVALVRSPQKARHLEDAGVIIAQGDITDKETMRMPMSGADGVFHMAGWYKVGVRDKGLATGINVHGTRNVLDMMKELGIKKGVYTSSLAVFSDTGGNLVEETYRYDGQHLSEYDRTKWAAHYEIAEPMMDDGLPLVIVLPGLIYGPGDTSSVGESFRKYLQGKLPSIPKETAFCWTHIDDAAQGHLLGMEKGNPGESYIIAGSPLTVEEAFTLAETITGVKPPRIHVSPGVLKLLSKITGVIDGILPIPREYTAEGLRVVAGVTYMGSNDKAQRELGYKVRPFEEGLRETLHHEMDQLGMTHTV